MAQVLLSKAEKAFIIHGVQVSVTFLQVWMLVIFTLSDNVGFNWHK